MRETGFYCVAAALFVAAFLGACADEVGDGTHELFDPTSDGVVGEREIPGADPDYTVGDDGRPLPDDVTPEDEPPSDDEPPTETDVVDPAEDPGSDGPSGAELTLVELAIPEDGVDAQTNALDADAWIFDRPNGDCTDTTGVYAPANGYSLANPGPEDVDVRLGLRTAVNGASLTLENGTLYAYASGRLPEFAQSCSMAGSPTATFASEVRGITVPAGGAIEFLVAGGGPADIGSYQISVIREQADTPIGGDATPAPDPGSDPGPDPAPPSDPAPAEGPGCSNLCAFAGDGTCDDGGPGATFSVCDLGSDCADCGVRAPEDDPTPDPVGGGCADTCSFAGDGVCDDGGAGSVFSVCELGTDCADCGPRGSEGTGSDGEPAEPPMLCADSCEYAFDGECDDGGAGSDYSICELGTDCGDCGPRSAGDDGGTPPSALCSDTCSWSGDGDCDDGGVGSDFSLCDLGTDCSDCGAR